MTVEIVRGAHAAYTGVVWQVLQDGVPVHIGGRKRDAQVFVANAIPCEACGRLNRPEGWVCACNAPLPALIERQKGEGS
jgi:hypothetical protein